MNTHTKCSWAEGAHYGLFKSLLPCKTASWFFSGLLPSFVPNKHIKSFHFICQGDTKLNSGTNSAQFIFDCISISSILSNTMCPDVFESNILDFGLS